MKLSLDRSVGLLIISVLFLWAFSVASTQASHCGNIIVGEVVTEIINCDNPFSAELVPYPFTLRVDNVPVNAGDIVFIPETGTDKYTVEDDRFFTVGHFYYLHEGDDYRLVDTEIPSLTEADYRRFALEFFEEGVDYEIYVQFLLGNPEGRGDPSWDWDLLINFSYYAEENFEPVIPKLLPGTYTLVSEEYQVFPTKRQEDILLDEVNRSFLKRLANLFIPVAHAQFPANPIYTLTFTLEAERVEPVVSNVLFLPGIQASRLYKDGVFGTEDQLWEPNTNQDVSQLEMTEEGLSVNDIYTKDVIDEINVLPIGQSNIYKSFLEMLEEMKDDGVISDYLPFAYDWRYNVHDIAYGGAKHANDFVILVDELKSLASSSYSGKVTIVAHSNGGLLAKALVTELVRRDLAHLVDRIIFIGTPHLGTPKAIGTILHGYDQQALGGAIIDDKTVRTVIKNMPGVYSLLPSAKYLDISEGPLITFQEGEVTELYRSAYEDSLDTTEEYVAFLKGTEGRTVEPDDISEPSTANAGLLDWGLSDHKNKLDDWAAPPGIEVHNIVGVGLKTVKSLEYRQVREHTTCSSNIFGQIICEEPELFIRPYAHFSNNGDETVISLSAERVSGETYYFDLDRYNKTRLNIFANFEHGDFLEVDEVRNIINNILDSTAIISDFVTSELPIFDQEYEVLSIDSPVRVVREDGEGNKTGVVINADGTKSIVKEIPGSEYLEFAGTKYLITPKDIDTTISLYGEAYGGFTLRRATLGSDDSQIVDTEMINATTSPNMVATFSQTDGVTSNVSIDIDGDGEADYSTDLRGELIEVEEEEVTFESLEKQIKDLDLDTRRERLLINMLRIAKKSYERSDRHMIFIKITDKALKNLAHIISGYQRKGWITSEEESALLKSITELRANIK